MAEQGRFGYDNGQKFIEKRKRERKRTSETRIEVIEKKRKRKRKRKRDKEAKKGQMVSGIQLYLADYVPRR